MRVPSQEDFENNDVCTRAAVSMWRLSKHPQPPVSPFYTCSLHFPGALQCDCCDVASRLLANSCWMETSSEFLHPFRTWACMVTFLVFQDVDGELALFGLLAVSSISQRELLVCTAQKTVSISYPATRSVLHVMPSFYKRPSRKLLFMGILH